VQKEGALEITGFARSISVLKRSEFQCCRFFFDTRELEDDWRAGENFTCLAISKWSLSPDKSSPDSYWICLILNSGQYLPSEPAEFHERVGLMVGPKYNISMPEWERKLFTLV